MAEIDAVLGIAKGQGVADLVLGNLIRDIIQEMAAGQTHGILQNWLWEDYLEAEATLKRLAQRWAREDGKGEEANAE